MSIDREMVDPAPRRAVAAVNVAAVERNTARLVAAVPGSAVCAVVKADGYGHGAVACARAAQAGGATWLAVATSAEAADLRRAGLEGRILVLGALAPAELAQALAAEADIVAWRTGFVAAVAAHGGRGRIHVKLDTGMGRLGTRDPAEALAVADAVLAAPGLELAGAMTHFATADDLNDPFFDEQMARFTPWAAAMRERAPGITVHAANSAALLRSAACRFDLVRPGIALYGMDPFGRVAADHDLEPALALHSYVAEIKTAAAGDSVGYGRRFVARAVTDIATVPIGYGDGWRRGLSNAADVLVGGVRRPLVGTVSMDNITLDLGTGHGLGTGARAVLIGAQGDEHITAEEIARRLGTINYEVTCGVTARVPRRHHRDGVPVP